MNVGKTLFAQVMEFVPWKTFGRIVERHKGDAGVRTLGCADLFRIMAFAQLTWRESLRDIEACLAANQAKLLHMGIKVSPAHDAGRRAQPARLAHLPCAGAAADRARPSAVCARTIGARPRCQRLCVGLHHHRSVSEPVAALYKSRRQVELFFKWIKQHLRIKRFRGTSENAVKTQIWCAVSTYVLIAIVKQKLQLDASLYTCLQILSVSAFEKTEISRALQPDRSTPELPVVSSQLTLFDI